MDQFSPVHYSIVLMFYIVDVEQDCTLIDELILNEELMYEQVDQQHH